MLVLGRRLPRRELHSPTHSPLTSRAVGGIRTFPHLPSALQCFRLLLLPANFSEGPAGCSEAALSLQAVSADAPPQTVPHCAATTTRGRA